MSKYWLTSCQSLLIAALLTHSMSLRAAVRPGDIIGQYTVPVSGISTATAVARNGTIYFAAYNDASFWLWHKKRTFALHAVTIMPSGSKELWTYNLKFGVQATPALSVDESVVYVAENIPSAARTRATGILHALNASSSTAVAGFHVELIDTVLNTPIVNPNTNHILFNTVETPPFLHEPVLPQTQNLYEYDAQGNLLKKQELESISNSKLYTHRSDFARSAPVLNGHGGAVSVVHYGTDYPDYDSSSSSGIKDARCDNYSATCTQWIAPNIMFNEEAFRSVTSCAVDSARFQVYTIIDGALTAYAEYRENGIFDAGLLIWKTPSMLYAGNVTVAKNGTVYANGADDSQGSGYIYAFNSNGGLLGGCYVGRMGANKTLVIDDNRSILYVVTYAGTLFAIDVGAEVPSYPYVLWTAENVQFPPVVSPQDGSVVVVTAVKGKYYITKFAGGKS